MKLWILRPVMTIDDVPLDPWVPWYDKAFGFVVRAETEEEARKIAKTKGLDETWMCEDAWTNSNYSTCVPLLADGEAGIVIEDVRSA